MAIFLFALRPKPTRRFTPALRATIQAQGDLKWETGGGNFVHTLRIA